MTPHSSSSPDIRNLLIALVVSTAIMFGWQYFYERPRMAAQKAAAVVAMEAKKAAAPEIVQPEHAAPIDRGPSIKINTPSLHGSIALIGARFDDLTLVKFRQTEAQDSGEVTLLSSAAGAGAYFAEIGVLPSDAAIRVPDATTRWQTDGTELTAGKTVTLTWNNGAGLTFERKITLDEHYMFTITTRVKNTAGSAVTLYPYGLVSRNYNDVNKHYFFMHEGPLGVMQKGIEDVTYKKLREDGDQKFSEGRGWIGMTDKYWLTALVPDQGAPFDATFKYFKRAGADAYQADLRGEAMAIPAGETSSFTMHFFAGAKVVGQLDAYATQYNIPLFDRAVDFGSLYFLTKPIFTLLMFLQSHVGNFGVAILLLTVCIKALMFPLANKSMISMSRMKLLMPEMTRLKEQHSADKMKMNQEIMALYKREKVNPLGGCLPIVLQIPVFFALYRVLFVTIEMRHAPFFGWIHDLSAADPTNLFTAFGYLPWDAPSILHLGLWPIVYCISMIVQQRLGPQPADEIQAAMMRYMPFMMTFVFASFPAGLVIYYTWNNVLTILQQLYINKQLEKKGLR